MNKLKKLLGLSLMLSLTACLVFLIFFGNKPLNAQTSSNTNSLPSNNYSASAKNWLEISAPIAGGITSTVAAIVSIIRVSNVQDKRIQLLKEDCERKEKELKNKEEQKIKEIKEIEEKYREKSNSSEEQKKLNTDFYALVYDELTDYNMTGVSQIHKIDESRKEFLLRLEQCTKAFESSKDAINGLLSSDKDGKKVLKYIVYNAIKKKSSDDTEENFKNKCKHLYSYLRGWLICSIRSEGATIPAKT